VKTPDLTVISNGSGNQLASGGVSHPLSQQHGALARFLASMRITHGIFNISFSQCLGVKQSADFLLFDAITSARKPSATS